MFILAICLPLIVQLDTPLRCILDCIKLSFFKLVILNCKALSYKLGNVGFRAIGITLIIRELDNIFKIKRVTECYNMLASYIIIKVIPMSRNPKFPSLFDND